MIKFDDSDVPISYGFSLTELKRIEKYTGKALCTQKRIFVLKLSTLFDLL